MTDFIIYLLKSSLMLGLFYVLYFLFLSRETFFHYNRIYILGALVISLVFPAMIIELPQQSSAAANNFELVNHAFVNFSGAMNSLQSATEENVKSLPVIPYLFVAGMLVVLVRILFQLSSIYIKIKKYEIKTIGRYHYVLIDQHHSTHSFFNYIFVHKSEFRKKHMNEVLVHEQMHANKLHSVDLLFIGFLSVLQWFNPFIYLFKRALVETHEFQADQAMISRGIDRNRYQRLLLEHARSVVMTGLTSNFNQSIIKNRLKMMNKIKSSNKAIIKYLMVFPIVFFVGIFFAISQEKIENSINKIINVTKDGDTLFGNTDFAIVNLPEDDRFNFHADELWSSDHKFVRMKGNVKLESYDKSIKVNAANVLINKEERKLYAFTDDYIPSISPIEVGKYKKITSGFGMRMHPILKKEMMHNGIDFSAETGTPVIASANGTVRSAEFAAAAKSYGNRVIIDHGSGFSTSYSQLEKFIVEAGQSVKKGEIIGYVGSTGMSTGPHLHYEIMKDGNYVDPADYFGTHK